MRAGQQVVARVVSGAPKLQTVFNDWEGNLSESPYLVALGILSTIFLLTAKYLEYPCWNLFDF